MQLAQVHGQHKQGRILGSPALCQAQHCVGDADVPLLPVSALRQDSQGRYQHTIQWMFQPSRKA